MQSGGPLLCSEIAHEGPYAFACAVRHLLEAGALVLRQQLSYTPSVGRDDQGVVHINPIL
jgi:hypothetical protein